MQRPIGVTLVGYLALIAAAFGLFLGGSALVGGWDTTPAWLPWLSVAWGAACLAVSYGLFRGNPAARIGATIAFAVGLVQGVVLLVSGDAQTSSGAVSLVTMVVGVLLLYTPRANEFFQR